MSFALAPQSKNKEVYNKPSTPIRRSSHGSGVSNSEIIAHDSIIHLQRTIGNQAIQRLLRSNALNDVKVTGIQAKLKISQPGDTYEQEADRVAEQVMKMSTSNDIALTISKEEERIDRKCSTCEMKKENEEEKNLDISRKPSTISNFEVSSEAINKISNMRASGGSSLDHDTQELMESKFGYDFGSVRIHRDAKAAESVQTVNALAYTLGEDIVFGDGQYNPSSKDGKRLLAHELTHVVQQSYDIRKKPYSELTKSPQSGKIIPIREITDTKGGRLILRERATRIEDIAILSLGSIGSPVRQLQKLLNEILENVVLVEDGIFGPKTEAAVVKFQNKLGLIPDGIVGPKTQEAIGGQVKPLSSGPIFEPLAPISADKCPNGFNDCKQGRSFVNTSNTSFSTENFGANRLNLLLYRLF